MSEPAGPLRRAVLAVAGRLGCTEGQVQTIAVGLAIALVAAFAGLPPVLRDRPVASAAAAAPAPPAAAAPAPTTTVPASPSPSAPAPATPRPSSSGAAGGSSTTPVTDERDDGEPSPPDDAEPAAAALGVPGTNGACAVEARSIDNPRGGLPVWIYEPSGDAEATIAGGRCDDADRPTVFVGHGFGLSDPTSYATLIEHLVSVGNVVVYPTYDVEDGSRATLEESTRVVDAGIVAAVEDTPRIDTTRVGWWGHSHGGGMVPYLVQQGGARGWGGEALWMSVVAQAYSQLVGADAVDVPDNTRQMSVAFEQDALADARLGIDIFESLVLPDEQKRHVTVLSGTHDGAPFAADHGAPGGGAAGTDAVDVLLWRYADLLETCALHDVGCDEDLTILPGADGTPEPHAVVSAEPVDGGPAPAVLAECDAVFGPTLNPRIARCGPTRVA